MSSGLEIREASPALGVVVEGWDLREELSLERQAELRDLLVEHLVLIFPGQQLETEDQVRVLAGFGPVVDEFGDGLTHYHVSNVREDGALGEEPLSFHADHMWTTDPVLIASLYGEELEGPVAPTRFANTVLAYADLPEDVKARIAGLDAVHLHYQPMMTSASYPRRQRIADLPPGFTPLEAPTAVHPVAYPRPGTGEPLLYVCEFFTSHIEGIDLEESEALLEELFEYVGRPDHVYEHTWREGDLIVWDNIAVQHGRPSFRNAGTRRTLRRVGVNTTGRSPRFSVGLGPI